MYNSKNNEYEIVFVNGPFVLKIRAKIEEELKGKDSGIIKIKFSAKEFGDLYIHENIHDAFNAEKIEDVLFIKVNFIID